jgi:hypothetical protein
MHKARTTFLRDPLPWQHARTWRDQPAVGYQRHRSGSSNVRTRIRHRALISSTPSPLRAAQIAPRKAQIMFRKGCYANWRLPTKIAAAQGLLR